ncbi:hypothetical protein RPMA_12510 [Tardiphaga alba]|uniref:DUF4402 domain-containing protein n=1 Tax=Tardiphaga alba TaxID=340268 RepID=A0ABX8A7F7_9BRAD|nr:hypothetical protein [Tardiphaga alba]QUS39567.1 hypothetical protein RPMA_12510 [Tardiphaga alba]
MIKYALAFFLLVSPAAAQTVVQPVGATQAKANNRADLVGKLNDLLSRADSLSSSLQANRVTATDDAAYSDTVTLIVIRSQVYDVQCQIAVLDGQACSSPPPFYGKAVVLKNALSAQNAEAPNKVWRLSGSLTVSAGLSLIGKKIQTITVAGVAAGDVVIITPKVTVPVSFTLGDARASDANTIELSVTFPQLVTLGAAVTIPVDVIVLR